MNKNRLEAFSDGVIAIILTIMVLGLSQPQGNDLSALKPLLPLFFSYALSFVLVAIYWVNHHHMFQASHKVNGLVLWLNLLLLFWLSLFPFLTSWLAQSHFSTWPVFVYGVDLLAAACAYYFLAHALVALHGPDSAIAKAIGQDRKGKISVWIYLASLPLAFLSSYAAYGLYGVVAIMWIVPDTRIERHLKDLEKKD